LYAAGNENQRCEDKAFSSAIKKPARNNAENVVQEMRKLRPAEVVETMPVHQSFRREIHRKN